MGAGLLLGAAGCAELDAKPEPDTAKPGGKPRAGADLRSSKTALQQAEDCPDLLTKIQDDAIAKLDLVVEQRKQELDAYLENPSGAPGGVVGGFGGGDFGAGVLDPGAASPMPTRGPSAGDLPAGGGSPGGTAGGTGTGGVAAPAAPPVLNGGERAEDDSGGNQEPTGASDTNTQVAGVDEADFVKLVDNGKSMFLLHGSSLRKLTTFPAEALALEDSELTIEGSPSELFVTGDGTAVVFSSVWGYGHPPSDVARSSGYCTPSWCGYGGSFTKITVADVAGATPKALREIYYRGNYVSSRRYGDIVRVVLQGYSSHSDLYAPDVDWSDAWGRPYEREQLEEQLDQWRERTASSIRNTTLADWLPVVQEVKDGQLVDVEPACGSYFVPQPGVSEYGLTHVLSIDVSDADAAVGGVTVIGQASTVYSSLDRLVLAQPDYRWIDGARTFGFIEQQRTTLHMFGLEAERTSYLASGWVTGHLPTNNQQFGLDVTADHTLRVAVSGRVRTNPQAEPGAEDFWATTQENRVFALRQEGEELRVVGESENLGHYEDGEIIRSTRFIGERGYVVTAIQQDPLIVLDLSDAERIRVLGQIEIPGFSMYVHPLDADHLITFGQSGSGGSQLQLFDVSDPASIPQPKLLDLGQTWSELASNHKAFTFYAEQNLIALPISGNMFVPMSDEGGGYYTHSAGLKVIQVDAERGFTLLGSVDHTGLYQQQSCLICKDGGGCYASCSAPVEVRRGHFVEGADATYVYGISYGGVSVSDVEDLAQPIETVVLPQPPSDGSSWYGTQGFGGVSGGFGGTTPGGFLPPPPGNPAVVAPLPVDGGVAVPEQDAGTDEAMEL